MPIAEPSSPLWWLVRLQVPWPDTDEDQAEELSRHWTDSSVRLSETIDRAEHTGAQVPGSWADPAGQALAGRLRDSAEFRRVQDEMRRAGEDAGRFAAEVRGTKQAIARYIEESTPNFLKTLLLAATPAGGAAPGIYAAAVAENLTQLLDAAAERIRGGQSATVLADPAAGKFPPPPPGNDPEATADWWKNLTDGQRDTIIAEHPELIGNRDGIPFADRDKANMNRLPEERARLRAERDELVRRYENDPDKPFLYWERQAEAEEHRKQLAVLDAKLASLDVVEKVANKDGRSLLLLTTDKERVEAAIGNGDVDNANQVAVFTPGLTTTVDGALNSYDTDLAVLKERTEQVLDNNGRDKETVATVAYLGYQAPQITVDSLTDPAQTVALDKAARAGADNLAGFLRGIDGARPVDPQLTALGHSYGSTTTGLALLQGTGVDRAAIWGSPGFGTTNPAELGLTPERILVLENPDDPVTYPGVFGGDPGTGLPSISGDTGSAPPRYPDDQPLTAGSGHSGYSARGSTNVHNVAALIAGEQDDIIRRPPINPWENLTTGRGLGGN
ncbi:alpha/beta hydrolase [Crossiella sp. CA198]|uniref:alpha/beta hydrolase n=1 Tax=Crossiella sp. CA198 TaxID=3455607 RepID=UPI003F8D38AD